MTTRTRFAVIGLLAAAGLSFAAHAQDGTRYDARGETVSDALSQSEIDDLISEVRKSGVDVSGTSDIRYVGASPAAIETVECCETVEERIEERTEVQESETYVPAITRRDVIQPIRRIVIQPVERRVPQAAAETVTGDMRVEETRLPARIERDTVPQVVTETIPQETVQTREDVTETTIDLVGRRDVIQPVERTVVVPVERRITRPRVETVTSETRYETRVAPKQVQAAAIPEVTETYIPQVTEEVREEVTEVAVPYIARRDVIQPVTRTTIQPVERQILRGTTETVTAPTEYVEERLPVRIEADPDPVVEEVVIQQVSERTVLEVQDVYIDEITRKVIQPVVITTVQPVERQILQAQTETVTAPVQYQEERLPVRVEEAFVPETVITYIPDVTEQTREEYTETYFDAVTRREVIQPVVRTLVQPVEIRRVRATTETVTAPTRYETVRAALIVLNLGSGCICADGTVELSAENCD